MTDMLARLAADVGDRYAVERELGRGGMATVYLARDLVADRDVAIKVMDPELAAAVGSERFKREIDVASRLQHPNILGVHDSGGAAGTLYYVMPYVTGESLRARLDRETQLPVEEAVRLACEVAGALHFAHSQGVVHRDIKPENVLLQDGHALVADFGIARATSAADSATLTKTGVAIGTPQYMSPEQIFAEKDIDGRTDEYALACLLYEMLAGQPPFVGPHAQSLMAQHALDDPPLVSRFRATVPTHVEDALLTALAKTRADRFPTLGEFSEALCNPGKHVSPLRATRTRGMAALPVQTVPQPMWRRVLPIASSLLLFAVAGAGAWQLWDKRGVAPATLSAEERVRIKRIAVLPLTVDDSSLAPVADGLTDALIDRLRSVATLDVRSRNAVAPYRGSRLRSDSIGRALDVGRVVVGQVSRSGDRLRVNVELRDVEGDNNIASFAVEQGAGDVLAMRDSVATKVADLLRESIGENVQLAEERAGTRSAEAWTTLQRGERARREADAAFSAGDTLRFAALLRRADSLAARAISMDAAWSAPHVVRAATAQRRADVRMTTDTADARRWLDSAVTRADTAIALDATDAAALDARGAARYGKSRLAGKVPALAEALRSDAERDLQSAVRLAPTQASAYNTLSRIAYARKNVRQASTYAEQALEADAYLSNAAATYDRIFHSSFDLGQFQDARKWCAQGRARFPDDALFVDCQLWLLLAPDSTPSPAAAWKLVPAYVERTPPSEREYARRYAGTLVAGGLGRVPGMLDSAKRVLVRSRADATVDPSGELVGIEAMARAQIGDREEAIRLLQGYFTRHPDHRSGFTSARIWLWAPISSDPRIRELTALAR